jgi:hypothetical protein
MNGTLPAVADVLTSDDKLYVVISLEVLENHRDSHATYEWQVAQWTFTFVDRAISSLNATSFGVMKDPNVLILYATLPRTFVGMADPSQVMHVDITAHLPQGTHTYWSVPFCLTPQSRSLGFEYKAAICMKSVPAEPWIDLLPEWIVYHIQQGFQHIYVYSVGDPQRLRELLSPLVSVGLVTIIDWDWPDKWVRAYAFSEAHQNACLLRARGVAEWVAFADVDEFWQPQMKSPTNGRALTVAETLTQPGICNQSALKSKTWYFGSNKSPAKQLDISTAAHNLTIAKWISRDKDAVTGAREKNIVRPEKITYMATHLVAAGPLEYELDPVSQMRVVHYKPQFAFDDLDDSMLAYVDGMESTLKQFDFH